MYLRILVGILIRNSFRGSLRDLEVPVIQMLIGFLMLCVAIHDHVNKIL